MHNMGIKSKKVLSILFALMMFISTIGINTQTIFAKNIGSKNENQQKSCQLVANGTAPDGYTPVVPGVYRGGNSYSGLQGGKPPMDTDPNDFANPLPYGNVYVDTKRLNWYNTENFSIDIKDDRFKWINVTGVTMTDKGGHTSSTNKPFGDNSPALTRGKLDDNSALSTGFIAYVGPLKPYHDDIKSPVDSDGFINSIGGDGDYLYKITYYNAVILPDGTRGNLEIKVTQVDIETSYLVDGDHPHVLKDASGNEYSYDKAVIAIQGPNQMKIAPGVTDEYGNYVNELDVVVKSKDEVAAIVDAANTYIPTGNKIGNSIKEDKVIRHTFGGAVTLEIKVKDAKGNDANGTLSYSAHDLDLATYQNIWGRDDSNRFMYAEGMEIIDGAESYALVPNYDHSSEDTVETGWVPNGITGSWDSPLYISGSSSDGKKANGVRFSSVGEKRMRDKNGLWTDALFAYANTSNGETNGTIRDFLGQNLNGSNLNFKDTNRHNFSTTVVKKLLAGKILDSLGNPKAWDQITAADIANYLGNASYSLERGDADTDNAKSFDTGFAVLINPAKTTLKWTGSTNTASSAVTTLFDSSIFTYIEQTHGTGGGIYLETYDMTNNCKVNMAEGTVTMGRHTDATVTAVPEDGYRVNRILIGDTSYGKGATGKSLEKYKTYTIDGNSVKDANGVELGRFAGTEDIPGFAGLKTGKVEIPAFNYDSSGTEKNLDSKLIVFERNSDGTVDITLPDVDNPMHIHVDYTANYYFYKVWKGEDPSDLKMTVAPYIFEQTEVTIEGVKYTIDGRTFTSESGESATLDERDILLDKYRLEGNKLVDLVTDAEYDIKVEYSINDSVAKKTFVVSKADAENTSENHVVESRDADGNKVWQITYPADGYLTKDDKTWPALPIEVEPTNNNHDALNHSERNYWFVTEDAPGWALVSYDNTTAKAPGVVNNTYYDKSLWYKDAIKDYDDAKNNIESASNDYKAYMSVFGPTANNKYAGGKITNVPAVIVKANKTWDDLNNEYNNRQDIWMHIDRTIINTDGSTTTQTDILPPQKISSNAKGSGLTVTWGDKKVYRTNDENHVVVSSMDKLPNRDSSGKRIRYTRLDNGSLRGSDGKYYWLNELLSKTGDGKEIQYSIRETFGTKNGSSTLAGYTSNAPISWEKLKENESKTILDNREVPTYTGKVENKMDFVDVVAEKIWNDDNNRDGYRDTVTFTISGLDGELTNNQETTQTIEVGGELKVEWKKLPKYENGSPVIYKVEETPLDNYDNPIVTNATDENGNVTFKVTNNHNIEVGSIKVTKTWDDNNNQDGLRKESGEVILYKTVDGSLQTVGDITPVTVPTEDGEFVYWDNLPLKENGEMIEYSIKENVINLPGYTTTYEGNNVELSTEETKEISITNTNTPAVTEITVEKVWEDKDNHDGIRPESINLTLKKQYQVVEITDAEVDPSGGDEVIKETKEVNETVTVGEKTYNVKEDENGVKYYIYEEDGEIKYLDPNDNHELKPADKAFMPNGDDETIKVEGTVNVEKTVEVDGESYDVLKDKNGVEYYFITEEETDKYYNAETKEELTVAEGVFEPDIYADEIIMVDKTGEVDKTITVDEVEYVIKKDKNGVEYYEKDGNYYNPEDNSVLIAAEKVFKPNSEDKDIIISGEVDKTITIDEVEYVIKKDKNGVEYYEKDGKYYNPEDNSELTSAPQREFSPAEEETDFVLSEDNNWTTTFTDLDVNSPEGYKIIYSVEEKEVPEGYEVVVEQTEDGKFTVTNTHNVTINPPTSDPQETLDYKGKTQNKDMKDFFHADPDTKAPGGGENKIEKITLIDPETGEDTDKVVVPGEGTYTIDENGVITFTPEPDFVGKTSGVKVRGYDSNNLTTETTYTPTVIVKVSYVDPLKDETVQDPKDSSVPGGTDITTTYEDTPGEESKNHPGYRFDGWEETIDPEDPSHYIRTAKYTPMYKITYDANGGDGEMDEDNYAADDPTKPSKDNAFTRKGYTFEGFTAEIIKPDGTIEKIDKIFYSAEEMEEYFKDMPGGTEIKLTAQWKKKEYHIHYDANGGSGTMTSQDFTGEDEKAISKENEFVREGYTFKGFKAVTKDGKDLGVFTSPEDFMKYLEEQGDGGEVTLIAQWEKDIWVKYVDEDGNTIYMKETNFPKGGEEPVGPPTPTKDGYAFLGWTRTVDPEGNITYVANWAKEIWVRYIDEDGNTIYMEETDFPKGGEEPAGPPTPSKDGFDFLGWTRTVDPEGNITYVAHWRKKGKPADRPVPSTSSK